jgi:hypothetical protein
MIRINLASPDIITLPRQEWSFRQKLTTSALVLFTLLTVLIFWAFIRKEASSSIAVTQSTIVLSAPARPQPVIHPTMAQVVEDVVSGQRVEPVKVIPKPIPDIAFEEKIGLQKRSMALMLDRLYSLTPQGIGYTHMVLEPPHHFYLSGMAVSQLAYNNFSDVLRRNSEKVEFLTLEGTPNGFTTYGMLNLGLDSPRESRVTLTEDQIKKLWELLRIHASTHQVRLGQIQHVDGLQLEGYARYTYRVSMSADFALLQRLFATLSAQNVGFGIARLSLRARDQGEMSAVAEFIVYGSTQ